MLLQSRILLISIASVLALNACGGPAPTTPQAGGVSVSTVAEPTFDEVTRITREHEHQAAVEDGWFFGELPRTFKSGYALTPPETKARFAMDLQAMLLRRGQNMVERWDSYVAYADRAQFAAAWWSNVPGGVFRNESQKMQVVWLHEALMDASELRWRALEEKNAERVNSRYVVAHDAEQKSVYDYCNEQSRARSFSDEYIRYIGGK